MRKRIRLPRSILLLVVACIALVSCSQELERGFSDPQVSELEDASFRLLVIGDFGSGDAFEDAVARGVQAMSEQEDADALVTTGDNIYPGGKPEDFDRAWNEPYGWVEDEGLDIVASLGNHDVQNDGGKAVAELLEMPAPYYQRTIGDAHIFVLDSNRMGDPAQTRWLEIALAEVTDGWKIAVFHHPAFSCAKHDSNPDVIARFVPILERHEVDLVLNGHDHDYQRFEERNGVTYVVTGGGGKGLYPVEECGGIEPDLIAANDTDHHFLYVRGNSEELFVDAVGIDGRTIDSFELGR